MLDGSEFQRSDAATGKECRPTVVSRNDVRVRRDVLPSAIDRLLLPAVDFGTVYLSTFSLLLHSQHFADS